ncbi:MAG: hypothetical protein AAF485_21915 [Chloroflexota bacterium]
MEVILFFCFGLAGVLFAVVIISSLATTILDQISPSEPRVDHPWRQFAEENDLTFVPSGLFRSNYMHGNYRGQQVKLKGYISKDNRYSYTKITMFRDTIDRSKQSLDLKAETDIEDTISELFEGLAAIHTLQGRLEVSLNAKKFFYKQLYLETSPDALKHTLDVLNDVTHDYATWVALGGEAVPRLQTIVIQPLHALRPVAIKLLSAIVTETKTRLGKQVDHAYCPKCLAMCQGHTINSGSLQPYTYYGCRLCRQSRNILLGKLTVVLNNETTIEKQQENDDLWVNWLIYRQLFDFEDVRIEQATEEEIERFVVQIGNDTDPERQGRYAQMKCQVSDECDLSENSQRLLQRTFGQVTFETKTAEGL